MTHFDFGAALRRILMATVLLCTCGRGVVDARVAEPWALVEDYNHSDVPVFRAVTTLSLTSEENLNTLKVLQAFGAAIPSFGWAGEDFCTWTGVSCFNSNITLVATDTPAAGTLPEMPDDVDYSLVRLEQINFLNTKTAIRGTLPASWHKLINVRSINLAYTSVSGTLPETWSSMESLQFLTLSFSNISGTLPACWSSMPAMKYITVSSTRISGTLPTEWSTMPRVERIYLQRDKLEGSFPASWAAMPSLELLGLQGNNFCGCLPDSWGSSANFSVGVDSKHRRSDCATASPCFVTSTTTTTTTSTTTTTTTTTTAQPSPSSSSFTSNTSSSASTDSATTNATTTTTTAQPSPSSSSFTSNNSSSASTDSATTNATTTTTTTTTTAQPVPSFPSCVVPNCLWCYPTDATQCSSCCCGYVLTAAGSCMKRACEDSAAFPVSTSTVSVLSTSFAMMMGVLLV